MPIAIIGPKKIRKLKRKKNGRTTNWPSSSPLPNLENACSELREPSSPQLRPWPKKSSTHPRDRDQDDQAPRPPPDESPEREPPAHDDVLGAELLALLAEQARRGDEAPEDAGRRGRGTPPPRSASAERVAERRGPCARGTRRTPTGEVRSATIVAARVSERHCSPSAGAGPRARSARPSPFAEVRPGVSLGCSCLRVKRPSGFAASGLRLCSMSRDT